MRVLREISLMRVLVDINVILDVLLDRTPHFAASAAVWAAVERGLAVGLLAAHAVTTIHYLIRKEHGSEAARRSLRSILRVFSVATIDEAVVEDAMHLSRADFEDAVSEAAARHARCDLIVTRDPSGFVGSHVRILPPEAAAALLTRESRP